VAEPLFEVEGAGAAPAGAGAAVLQQDVATAGGAGPVTIVLRVHVQPAAGKAAVVGRHGDALHVRVAAPPVGGRANAATSELIAEVLDVKASQVELAGGERSRTKRFRVRDVEADDVARKLDVAIEQSSRRGSGGGARSRARR
jgi:uncharacterized protein (TIGR00251 family)